MAEIISKIKSKYILEKIFAHINYKTVLKLTKYNKHIQNKLGLNIDLFKEWSSYKFEERTIINHGINASGCEKCFCSCCCSFIIFNYVLIVASILASKGAFNESNTKDNYDKNYSKIIDKINYSLFGFLAYIIISNILIIFWLFNNCENDYGQKKIIKIIISTFLFFIYIFYEILIIIKLYYSYKIKKKVTWFIICDYILIILLFLYIFVIMIHLIVYCALAGESANRIKKLFLIKFRDIKINDYELPDDFSEMTENGKRKLILDNQDKYEIPISEYEKNLISSINNFRKENNIGELSCDEKIFYKDLIIDKYAGHIFSKFENLFELSNTNYLFKYPLDEFKKQFDKREKNIINILLKDNLEKIIIIQKEPYEFINIFESQKIIKPSDIDIHIQLPSEIIRFEYKA